MLFHQQVHSISKAEGVGGGGGVSHKNGGRGEAYEWGKKSFSKSR